MTVTLTSPVEGKQPGDTYTGANEAFLLAEGYATQAGYTGPGVANTGPATTTKANEDAAHSERALRAVDSSLGDGGGTNTNVVLSPPDAPRLSYTGSDGPTPEVTSGFDGFSNDPAAVISSLTPSTGLAVAGGTAVVVTGYGFAKATAVQFGGTAGTAFSVVSDRELHVTTPAKAAGSYTVTVVRPEGNLTKANGATFA